MATKTMTKVEGGNWQLSIDGFTTNPDEINYKTLGSTSPYELNLWYKIVGGTVTYTVTYFATYTAPSSTNNYKPSWTTNTYTFNFTDGQRWKFTDLSTIRNSNEGGTSSQAQSIKYTRVDASGTSNNLNADRTCYGIKSITISYTGVVYIESASSASKTLLNVAGKFLDRNIEISINPTKATISNPSPTITPDNPTIVVGADGKITASVPSTSMDVTPNVVEGWAESGSGIKGTISVSAHSNTLQMTTKGATSYTPTTQPQTIASGVYLTGTQTILGDANLIASNIRNGVSIFGVTGTLKSIATDTETTNATASYILSGYEAWDANANRILGTMNNFTGSDITSSVTSGKTISYVLDTTNSLYTIKMYMGSTGYVVKDNTYITETIAESKMDNTRDTSKTINPILPSGTDQTVTISSGYNPSDRTITIKKMTQGVASTSAETITPTISIGSTYSSGNGYPITASGSVTPTASVGTMGYIGSKDNISVGAVGIKTGTIRYVAQSTIADYTSSIPSSFALTDTISASGDRYIQLSSGYHPSARYIKISTPSGSATMGGCSNSVTGNSAFSTTKPSGTANVDYITTKITSSCSATIKKGFINADSTPSATQGVTDLYIPIYKGEIDIV